MSDRHEDELVDLDSSSSLEFDRRIIVQESEDSVNDLDVSRLVTHRQHCQTNQREILQQPFQGSEFRC